MADAHDFHAKPEATAVRQEFYGRLNHVHTAPLWEVLSRLVTPEPRSACVPALWRYSDIRPLIMEAGGLVTAKEAERRVLVLENPGVRGESRITQSLYAGLQLVLPGEIAPGHRHTASALRFIVEGTGAYTTVEGERLTMHPGDFLLTPNWTWHDHGNLSQEPVVWLDGLDVPLVNTMDASFAEHYAPGVQTPSKPEHDSLARFGATMMPVDYEPARPSSPVFAYPYSRSRETLETLYRNGPVHACHGVKLQYVNPVTGGYPVPTMAAFLQLLPKGFRGSAYRATDATIFCGVEGSGRVRVGDQTFEWQAHDVFVAPSWLPVVLESENGGVLFSFSDRPAQKALGLWREQCPFISGAA
jgi:gentisate 1,2-dioxygenase